MTAEVALNELPPVIVEPIVTLRIVFRAPMSDAAREAVIAGMAKVANEPKRMNALVYKTFAEGTAVRRMADMGQISLSALIGFPAYQPRLNGLLAEAGELGIQQTVVPHSVEDGGVEGGFSVEWLISGNDYARGQWNEYASPSNMIDDSKMYQFAGQRVMEPLARALVALHADADYDGANILVTFT